MIKEEESMKKSYFVNFSQLDDPQATIIDETALEAAERGENYLNPNDFMFHGEFENADEARQALWNEQGESLLCLKYDY